MISIEDSGNNPQYEGTFRDQSPKMTAIRRFAWSCATIHDYSEGENNIAFGHPGGLVDASSIEEAYERVSELLSSYVRHDQLKLVHYNVWPVDSVMESNPFVTVEPDEGKTWIAPPHHPGIEPKNEVR